MTTSSRSSLTPSRNIEPFVSSKKWTDLAHSVKKFQKFLILTQKQKYLKIFYIFSKHRFWTAYLAHLTNLHRKRNFYPKSFLYLPEKNNFSRLKKKFLILSRKNFLCSSEKNNFLHLPEIKNFLSKEFLILVWKTNSIYLSNKWCMLLFALSCYCCIINVVIHAVLLLLSHIVSYL